MTTTAKIALGTAFGAALAAFAAAPAIAGESVTYQAAGADYEGYYAPASGDSKGLVLVIHDWDGLTDYEKKRADMLAELGYDAFALDMFGKGNRPESMDARKAETGKLYEDREAMLTRVTAGLETAREQSGETEAVVMGYCFGGAGVLELARSGKAENVAGYATFHGTLATPEGQSYPDSTAPILIAQGGGDTSSGGGSDSSGSTDSKGTGDDDKGNGKGKGKGDGEGGSGGSGGGHGSGSGGGIGSGDGQGSGGDFDEGGNDGVDGGGGDDGQPVARNAAAMGRACLVSFGFDQDV